MSRPTTAGIVNVLISVNYLCFLQNLDFYIKSSCCISCLVFGARGLRQGSGIFNANGTHGAAHLSSHTKQFWQDSRSSSAGISKDQYQNNRSVILFYHSF